MPFIPINKNEALERGWSDLDIIFVSGDAYVDHPAFGVPLLARLLEAHGFRVGIIPQPDWRTKDAFTVLGRPRMFFAVSAGAMDSMVAHYTAARKLRSDDAYTPGNRHGARPNRATIVYTSRIKEAYKGVPVVIGGVEASLRRFVHYDFWEDKVRRSILLDSKADMLIYGMAEHQIVELADRLRNGEPFLGIRDIRGTSYVDDGSFKNAGGTDETMLELPSFEAIVADRYKFAEAFRLVSGELNPFCSSTIRQRHGNRDVINNPPAIPLAEDELDALYELPFEKAPHPSYKETIPAHDQIKASVTTHRGCFGGCAFCAIAQHQGKIVQSRSERSVLSEVRRLTAYSWFKGSVSDVGGPTANMYGLSCTSRLGKTCRQTSCLYPKICRHLSVSGKRATNLLRNIRALKGVRHVAVSSGVRYDLQASQQDYFAELLSHHVGGLLKVAPEHLSEKVTAIMRKPHPSFFVKFLGFFNRESRRAGKRQHIVPYLISGHPGCTLSDMVDLALELKKHGLKVEQVQDFTPTPGTLSACMYYTGIDPFTGEAVYVARNDKEKLLQKALLLYHLPEQQQNVMQAIILCGREEAAHQLLRYSSLPKYTKKRC